MKPCPNEKDLYPEHTPAGKPPPSKSAVDTAQAIFEENELCYARLPKPGDTADESSPPAAAVLATQAVQ